MHGWGGSKISFACIQNLLIRRHKTLSIDFPGFGREPAPKAAFGVEDYAAWLKEKLSSLGIEDKVTLVGHSFGGRVAIVYAAKYAGLVDRVVLVDSAGIKPKFKINKAIKKIWFRFCKKCAKIGLYKKERLTRHGSSDWKNLPENMKGTFVKVIGQDLSCYAKLIRAKTLLVWGEKDKDTPLYMAKKLNKLIKSSRLVIFENAGHYSYVDCRAEFASLLNNFLD